MFELEFINLINQYKNNSSEYDKKKIKASIINLMRQNYDKYQEFKSQQNLTQDVIDFLRILESELNNSEEDDFHDNDHNNKFTTLNDDLINVAKTTYVRWLDVYLKNNKNIDIQNNKIVDNLIFYALSDGLKIKILEVIFNLDEGEDFESFKWHIKNELRKYYIEKIKEYTKTDSYLKLSFLKKRKKSNQVCEILEKIGKYEFDFVKIDEVLN